MPRAGAERAGSLRNSLPQRSVTGGITDQRGPAAGASPQAMLTAQRRSACTARLAPRGDRRGLPTQPWPARGEGISGSRSDSPDRKHQGVPATVPLPRWRCLRGSWLPAENTRAWPPGAAPHTGPGHTIPLRWLTARQPHGPGALWAGCPREPGTCSSARGNAAGTWGRVMAAGL